MSLVFFFVCECDTEVHTALFCYTPWQIQMYLTQLQGGQQKVGHVGITSMSQFNKLVLGRWPQRPWSHDPYHKSQWWPRPNSLKCCHGGGGLSLCEVKLMPIYMTTKHLPTRSHPLDRNKVWKLLPDGNLDAVIAVWKVESPKCFLDMGRWYHSQ